VLAVEIEGVHESFFLFLELKGRMTLLYCIINSFSVGCSFIKGLCLGRSTLLTAQHSCLGSTLLSYGSTLLSGSRERERERSAQQVQHVGRGVLDRIVGS